MKLLIVDDNQRMRSMMCQMFDEDAEEIFECSDGEEAVEFYTNNHPDFILMDIEMKKMDGLTATEIILKSNPGAKIIIVTQYDALTFQKAALAAGAIGFVGKENLIMIKEFFKNDKYTRIT